MKRLLAILVLLTACGGGGGGSARDPGTGSSSNGGGTSGNGVRPGGNGSNDNTNTNTNTPGIGFTSVSRDFNLADFKATSSGNKTILFVMDGKGEPLKIVSTFASTPYNVIDVTKFAKREMDGAYRAIVQDTPNLTSAGTKSELVFGSQSIAGGLTYADFGYFKTQNVAASQVPSAAASYDPFIGTFTSAVPGAGNYFEKQLVDLGTTSTTFTGRAIGGVYKNAASGESADLTGTATITLNSSGRTAFEVAWTNYYKMTWSNDGTQITFSGENGTGKAPLTFDITSNKPILPATFSYKFYGRTAIEEMVGMFKFSTSNTDGTCAANAVCIQGAFGAKKK